MLNTIFLQNVNIENDPSCYNKMNLNVSLNSRPETRFGVSKKTVCSEQFENGNVKTGPGFSSKSPQGFAKSNPAKVTKIVTKRTQPAQLQKRTKIENINISTTESRKSLKNV